MSRSMHEKLVIYRKKFTSDVSCVSVRQTQITNTYVIAEIMAPVNKLNVAQLLDKKVNLHGIISVY